jgi:hypothetical protein
MEIKAAQASISTSLASNSAGSATSVLVEQKKALQDFERLLKDSTDSKRVKKSIQFENYRTQKRK